MMDAVFHAILSYVGYDWAMRHYRTEQTGIHLDNTFSLICWNVHKEMGRTAFDHILELLVKQREPALILLQEAVLDQHTGERFAGYNVSAAVNINLNRRQFGVLTAAKAPMNEALGLKTKRREMHFATRKSLLITTHPFADGTELTAVNLHAINFVAAAAFVEEIDRLLETIRLRSGPMIVTGDFNTWSRKRLEYLQRFALAVGLETARFTNGHHIKHRFSKPLDHLYYRDLSLLNAEAVDTRNVSDHNPIIATFRH